MSVNKAPISRPLYALLVLILSCAGASTWSQESDKPDADSTTTVAPDQGANADTSEPQAISENSPSDYEASEEISQDRSVSFPADI
jgi:hypothetical protein